MIKKLFSILSIITMIAILFLPTFAKATQIDLNLTNPNNNASQTPLSGARTNNSALSSMDNNTVSRKFKWKFK